MKIFAACPACGGTEWSKMPDCHFKCLGCGCECYPEEMELKTGSDACKEDEQC